MSDRIDHTLEHALESKGNEPGGTGLVRRIELITGSGRRRRWSTDEKARILLESLKPGANVSEVARRHGLSPQQLFGWRREARELIGQSADEVGAVPVPATPDRAQRPRTGRRRSKPCKRSIANEPAFAPVVIAATAPGAPLSPPVDTPSAGRIEIALGDAVVRVIGQVEPAPLATVLRAVRRAS
jgi:transposase